MYKKWFCRGTVQSAIIMAVRTVEERGSNVGRVFTFIVFLAMGLGWRETIDLNID